MGKKIGKFILIGFIIYIVACLTLIYLPTPKPKNIENFDYSSIEESQRSALGKPLWIKTRDGSELFNRIYTSESNNVLILIHGSGTESRYLASLADSISKAKIATVLTPDLRGHGNYKGKKGDVEYIGQLEGDLADLISFSKRNLEANNILLAGHSSGGGLVLKFIGNPRNPSVDKAIMLAPYLGHDAITSKPNSGGWVTIALRRIIGLTMLNNIGINWLDGLPVLFFNRPENIDDELQAPSYSFRMMTDFAPNNYKDNIKKIHIPCLVLVGDQDESFYPEQFEVAFGPAAKFVDTKIMDNTNHLGLVNERKTFEVIKRWLAQQHTQYR